MTKAWQARFVSWWKYSLKLARGNAIDTAHMPVANLTAVM